MKVKKALTFGLRVWPPLPPTSSGGLFLSQTLPGAQHSQLILPHRDFSGFWVREGFLNFKELQRTWGLLKSTL